MNNKSKQYNSPQRHNLRLRNYDYGKQGEYFVTICTKDKLCLFGDITSYSMKLNSHGEIIKNVWQEIPLHYPEVTNDVFTIMPNHIHGIISIRRNPQVYHKQNSTKIYTLSEIIRGFKTFSSRKINELRDTKETQVWQRNYYEHIIRNEKEYHQIGEYILFNALKWDTDRNNPEIKGSCQNFPFEY